MKDEPNLETHLNVRTKATLCASGASNELHNCARSLDLQSNAKSNNSVPKLWASKNLDPENGPRMQLKNEATEKSPIFKILT